MDQTRESEGAASWSPSVGVPAGARSCRSGLRKGEAGWGLEVEVEEGRQVIRDDVSAGPSGVGRCACMVDLTGKSEGAASWSPSVGVPAGARSWGPQAGSEVHQGLVGGELDWVCGSGNLQSKEVGQEFFREGEECGGIVVWAKSGTGGRGQQMGSGGLVGCRVAANVCQWGRMGVGSGWDPVGW